MLLAKLPPHVRERILTYLLADQFPAAKALYNEWLKTSETQSIQ